MRVYTVTVVSTSDNQEMIFLAALGEEELARKLSEYLAAWQEQEELPDHEFEDCYELIQRDAEV